MYQALYRKWRPRTFDDVVGQKHITETLKNQVSSGRLSHAYLFTGTRGTGKTSCAKILAKAVNCENPINGNPCNRCSACLGIDDGSVMDVVEMDAASNNGVDNVRALRDEAIFSPATVKKRVYIVDEVHMLSVSAFNALLKILEEPPEHLLFILATTELQKVPATILSRCQRHSFKRLDIASISGRLEYIAGQEQLNLAPEAANLIARLADGGMRDAVSMLDQCSGREMINVETVYSALGLAGRQKTVKLLEYIAAGETFAALELFSQLWKEGKDPGTLLGELSGLQRDILISRVAPKNGAELMTGGYDGNTIETLSGLFSTEALISNIKTIQQSLADMRNGQVRTVCELCIIAMSSPSIGIEPAALAARIAALETVIETGHTVAASPSKPRDAASGEGIIQAKAPKDNAPLPMHEEDERPPFDLTPPPERETRPVREKAAPARKATHIEAASKLSFDSVPALEKKPDFSASAQEGGNEWQSVVASLKGKLPVGIMALITDPLQVSGKFFGDELRIYAASGFAMNNLNRPDVTERIRNAAAEGLGRRINVVIHPADATQAEAGAMVEDKRQEPQKADKLDELGKFDIVQFK